MESHQTMNVADPGAACAKTAPEDRRSLWERFFGRHRGRVHLVPGGKWAFYWISHYLAKYLRKRSGLKIRLCENPWTLGLKGEILHFVSRQKYFLGPFRTLDPSNRVSLFWTHGDPRSLITSVENSHGRLMEAVHTLTRIVVPCEATRQDLLRAGIPQEKIVRIPIGVDVRSFMAVSERVKERVRLRLGIPSGAPCIGSFQKDGEGWGEGREPKLIKGPDVFLDTLSIFRKKHPKVVVLLTGPARGYVKQGLKKLGIRYFHAVLGDKDYRLMPGYYHALDMYLIASRCEGGPKSLMESWATGVPVVSTRMGMPADWLSHRQNGMMADSEDAGGLASSMDELTEDAALRRSCILQGGRTVQSLDWAKISNQHFDKLYRPYLRRQEDAV